MIVLLNGFPQAGFDQRVDPLAQTKPALATQPAQLDETIRRIQTKELDVATSEEKPRLACCWQRRDRGEEVSVNFHRNRDHTSSFVYITDPHSHGETDWPEAN